MLCSGQVWVGWRYQPCRNPSTIRLGDRSFCRRCCPPIEPTMAITEDDESDHARSQLTARLAGRLAERMGWPDVKSGAWGIILTPEQAAELVERLP